MTEIPTLKQIVNLSRLQNYKLMTIVNDAKVTECRVEEVLKRFGEYGETEIKGLTVELNSHFKQDFSGCIQANYKVLI